MATIVQTVIGVVAEFLATNPTPQQILAYKFPENIQQRLELLLEGNSADTLTPEERTELQEIVRMDQFMGLVKAKTKLKMKQAEHGDK